MYKYFTYLKNKSFKWRSSTQLCNLFFFLPQTPQKFDFFKSLFPSKFQFYINYHYNSNFNWYYKPLNIKTLLFHAKVIEGTFKRWWNLKIMHAHFTQSRKSYFLSEHAQNQKNIQNVGRHHGYIVFFYHF